MTHQSASFNKIATAVVAREEQVAFLNEIRRLLRFVNIQQIARIIKTYQHRTHCAYPKYWHSWWLCFRSATEVTIFQLNEQLVKPRPHPPLRQHRQPIRIHPLRLHIPLAGIGALPLDAALGQDAGQQRGRRFIRAGGPRPYMRQLRLGGHQPALARGLEHGRLVAPQGSLHPLQRRHAGIQAAELGLDLGDDAVLFVRWCNRYELCSNVVISNRWIADAALKSTKLFQETVIEAVIEQVLPQDTGSGPQYTETSRSYLPVILHRDQTYILEISSHR